MNGKPYIREIPVFSWYLGRKRDIHHMLNEVSSLFIGSYALLLLWGLKALSEGEAAYSLFLQGLTSPVSIGLHWLMLAFTLLHSISWFSVTPKAMPVQIGENFLPGYFIAAGHYVAWFCISLFILYIGGVFSYG